MTSALPGYVIDVIYDETKPSRLPGAKRRAFSRRSSKQKKIRKTRKTRPKQKILAKLSKDVFKATYKVLQHIYRSKIFYTLLMVSLNVATAYKVYNNPDLIEELEEHVTDWVFQEVARGNLLYAVSTGLNSYGIVQQYRSIITAICSAIMTVGISSFLNKVM